MRNHTVGLLLNSPLLTAGIQAILHKEHGISIVDIAEDSTPQDYTTRISALEPSLVIVDPFTRTYCPSDVPSMLISVCQIPDTIREGHAATASIFDSRDAILNRIRSLVEPGTQNDQRGSDLSPREKDVILRIVKGMSNKEIAAEMNVSVNTVMTHRRNIASKLEIHSPAGLTIFAIATGMVKIEDVAL